MAHASIRLDQLTVVNKREATSKDEAYLWVIGMQIVVPSSNVPGLEFIHAVSPLPGNVGGAMKRGETRAIPAATGHLDYEVTYPGLATFGVAVLAWEHDRTPNAVIQSAYNQSTRLIDTEIRNIIDAILTEGADPSTGQPREVTQAEQDAIQVKVKSTIKKVLKGSLGVAPWTLNFDDFVGADRVIATVKGDAPFSQAFTMDLRKHDNVGAHYRVSGTLSFTPDRKP